MEFHVGRKIDIKKLLKDGWVAAPGGATLGERGGDNAISVRHELQLCYG